MWTERRACLIHKEKRHAHFVLTEYSRCFPTSTSITPAIGFTMDVGVGLPLCLWALCLIASLSGYSCPYLRGDVGVGRANGQESRHRAVAAVRLAPAAVRSRGSGSGGWQPSQRSRAGPGALDSHCWKGILAAKRTCCVVLRVCVSGVPFCFM